MHPPYVAVVGPGDGASEEQSARAFEAGRLLAESGYVVVTGGLTGVMGAAAAGVQSARGTAVALLPGDDRAAASPGHAIVVPTGLGEMRNALLVRTVDALVAIGGSWGTLSEIAFAMRTGVPVFTVESWELPQTGVSRYDTVRDAIEAVRAALPRAP